MDPFMECHWGDMHASLVVYASDQIRPLLPPGLRARIDERAYVEGDYQLRRKRRPNKQESIDSAVLPAVDDNFVSVLVRGSTVTETFVQIIDMRSSDRVITVIEFVGPNMKRSGPGRDAYSTERDECRQAGVNMVEIDLTLEGSRESIFPQIASLDCSPTAAYVAMVTRATNPDEPIVYQLPLQYRLPSIAIPLRASDSDIFLDLQPLIEHAYEGYDFLDYTQPPPVPLGDADAKWADEMLRTAGKR